jgi:hypothetical protein
MAEPIKDDELAKEFESVRIKAKAQKEYDALITNKLGEDAELGQYKEKDYLLVQSVIPHWNEGNRNNSA